MLIDQIPLHKLSDCDFCGEVQNLDRILLRCNDCKGDYKIYCDKCYDLSHKDTLQSSHTAVIVGKTQFRSKRTSEGIINIYLLILTIAIFIFLTMYLFASTYRSSNFSGLCTVKSQKQAGNYYKPVSSISQYFLKKRYPTLL